MGIYKLGDVAVVNMCKRVLRKDTSKNGDIPFFKISTLGGIPDSFISRELFNKLKKYKYPEKGDSLISVSGTIGKIVQYKGEDAFFQDSNIVWIKTNLLKNKYLYYWLKRKPFTSTQGATIKRLYNSDIYNTKIFIPKKKTQQKIIEIIEPIENAQNLIRILINKFKFILKSNYIFLNSNNKKFLDIVKIINKKYEGQNQYFATNAVGELSIDYSKMQFVENTKPSRANLSVSSKSIIFSKLIGENKLFYFERQPQEIFSTGFFNIKTEYVDHVIGFMLSNDFKMQKKFLSTGSTMMAINKKVLSEVLIKSPQIASKDITKSILALVKLDLQMNLIKSKMINLLIK